jgi:hypothetical protein
MTIEDIVAAYNQARAAFIALEPLLQTDVQRRLYHKTHVRLDKAASDFQVIITDLSGPQTFDGEPKPPNP